MTAIAFQTKPSSLQEMALQIRQTLEAKRLNKGRKLTGRRDIQSETESKEQRQANAIAQKIEDELKWIPTSFVLLQVHQHCQCGQSYQHVVGLFLESIHQVNKTRRLGQPKDLSTLDRLPHKREEVNEPIGICHHCLLERELVDSLFNPVSTTTVQLPLWGHVMQQRSCT